MLNARDKYFGEGEWESNPPRARGPRESGFADQEERQLHYPSDDDKIEFRKQLDADERSFCR